MDTQHPAMSLATRHGQLRQGLMQLHQAILAGLPQALAEGRMRALGVLEGNALTVDSKQKVAAVLDHCLYNVRQDGQTLAERHLERLHPAPESDEALLLEAMDDAWYSAFVVERAEPGSGIQVRDSLRGGESFLLMDQGLSLSARPGVVLATRVLEVAGLHMTTGAVLPLMNAAMLDAIQRAAGRVFGFKTTEELSEEEWTETETIILRHALGGNVAEPKQPRNEPCACGSGQKYKKCCGKN